MKKEMHKHLFIKRIYNYLTKNLAKIVGAFTALLNI